MALAGKTAAKRNLDDRSIGFAEKPLGLVYPPPKHEAMRRFAELPTKRACEIKWIQSGNFSQCVKG